MESGLAEYHIDDEARRRSGRHRSGPMIEKLLASGDPTDRQVRELFDWVMLERIRKHAYEQVWTEDQRERFERDPVPNRAGRDAELSGERCPLHGPGDYPRGRAQLIAAPSAPSRVSFRR